MVRRDFAPFTKGLITDTIGVEGALMEAMDVVIDRAGEVRKRGVKHQVSSWGPGVDSMGGAVYSPSVGYMVQIADGSSVSRVIALDPVTSTLTSLSTRQDGSGGTPSGYSFGGGGSASIVHGSEIVASSATYAALKWAGNVETRYSTGTVTTTLGSTTITGAGTTWTASHVGMYLWINHATLRKRAYRVKQVLSATSVIVDQPAPAAAAGQSYALNPVGFVAAPDNIFASSSGASVNDVRDVYAMASHQGRLFIGGTREYIDGTDYLDAPERLRWSATTEESNGSGFCGVDYWSSAAYTDIGSGHGGDIKALSSFGGDLIIFKESAIYVLRGIVTTDGTDLGASIDKIASDRGVYSQKAVVETPRGIAFANNDGLFLYRSGQVESLTSQISTKWRGAGFGQYAVLSYISATDRLVAMFGSSTFVLDMEHGIWTMQGGVAGTTCGNIVNEHQWVGAKWITWSNDFDVSDAYQADQHNSSYPRMHIQTHPMPIGDGITGQGRVNTVYANGWVSGTGATLAVSLVQGRSVSIGPNSSGAPVQVSVGSIPVGTFDKTYRLPVDSASAQYSAARVDILEVPGGGGTLDARIYGISLDFAPTSVIA